MGETVYIGVRVSRDTYELLQRRQKTAMGDVSMAAIVRHILAEAVKKERGKK